MDKIFKIAIILMLWICPALPMWCQELPYKHYSFKDGLASSSMNCIYQDSRGFLWFGTQDGVSRFDGIEFRNFFIEDGLTDAYILDITEDPSGALWFATRRGGVIRYHSGKFRAFTQKNGLAGNRALSLSVDRDGHVWIGTGGGLNMFDGKGFITFSKKDGLSDSYTRAVAADNHGRIWVGTPNGLNRLTPANPGPRVKTYTTRDGLPSNNIRTILIDSKGVAWIGTDRGAVRCRNGKIIPLPPWKNMTGTVVNSIMEDQDNRFWFATDRGLICFSSGSYATYFSAPRAPGKRILKIFQDREGNFWFAGESGVSRIISLDTLHYSTKDGLAGTTVWSIIRDRQGSYWIGTGSGLNKYRGNRFETLTTREGLAGNFVYRLMEDNEGKIWIGTMTGLSIYSGGKFKNHTQDDGFPSNIITAFANNRRGGMWIGTVRGLCMMEKGSISPPPFSQAALPVHAVIEDKKGNTWFSDTGGLLKWDKKRLTRFTTADGLINNDIYVIFEDSRGRLWIGTKMGLSCHVGGIFRNFSTRDGLINNSCYFVREDKKGDLWIGTSKGIHRLDSKSFRIHPFSKDLVSYEITQGAGLLDNNGDLWFGTVQGATRLKLPLKPKNATPPPVYISRIKVFEDILPHPGKKTIYLEHHRNYLRFDFVGLSFTSPEDVTYRYRLHGIDGEWFTTESRSVSYPYLPPGTYSFEVVARNHGGLESPGPAKIDFKINPPFWATPWFRGLAVLIIVLLLTLFAHWRYRRVREKAAMEAKNKQLVLAQKMELLGLLAGGAVHDLKNLMGIIVNYSGMAARTVDREDKKSKFLEKIQQAAYTAGQLSRQILSFTTKHAGENSNVNLPDLLEEIMDILKITVLQDIEVQVDIAGGNIRSRINPAQFQQLTMNLCINARDAMPDGGKLTVVLREEENRNILFEVSDTGTGIDTHSIEKIFDPLYTTKMEGKGTGLGLFVVKQIADQHGGTITVRNRPGQGTTFQFSFPIR